MAKHPHSNLGKWLHPAKKAAPKPAPKKGGK